MTQATEYMIFEADDQGVFHVLPHCGSFYTDRWYGEGDDALRGTAAAWAAVSRVAATNGGVYTVIKIREFERPEGQGLVGGEPTPEVVRTPAARPGLLSRALSANPAYWYAAGTALLILALVPLGDDAFAAAETMWRWITSR
jgi:hypothetical protein